MRHFVSSFSATDLAGCDCGTQFIATLQTPLIAHPDIYFAQPPKHVQDLFGVRALLTVQDPYSRRATSWM